MKLLRLEALSVDNRRSRLVVLLLGDPHLLEGGEGSKNGTTNPDRELSLGRSNDLDLHGRRSKSSNLLLHTLGNTGVHGGTTRHDNVTVKILTDINITLHDRVVSGLINTSSLKTQDRGVEESLRSSESLVTNGDDLTIRKLVALFQSGGLGSSLELLLKVKSNVTELLLNLTDNFTLGRGGERVTSLSKNLHEVVGQVTASQVNTHNGVGEGETSVNGDNVGDTITGIENDTSGTTRGVKGKNGLDRNVESRGVEGLKDNLGHLLSVGLGVDGGLSQEDRVLLGSNSELIVKSVMPNLLHIIPVCDDTVLNGVSEGKNTTLGLGLVTDVGVLLVHADHDTLMSGATDNRGENSTGSIITGKTGLAHTGTVINNEGSNFV